MSAPLVRRSLATGALREPGCRIVHCRTTWRNLQKGILRGLHAQEPHAQGKLVQIFDGAVFDVAVDLRSRLTDLRAVGGIVLDANSGNQGSISAGLLPWLLCTQRDNTARLLDDRYLLQPGTSWPCAGMTRILDRLAARNSADTVRERPRCSVAARYCLWLSAFLSDEDPVTWCQWSGRLGTSQDAPPLGAVTTSARSGDCDRLLDATDFVAVAGCFDEMVPDVIVNAAAYTAVDQAESEPDLAMRLNAELPALLGRWASGQRTGYALFDGLRV